MGQVLATSIQKYFGMEPIDKVSFPKVVDQFVQGGDLLFIEEKAYFDDYTILNT